MADAADAGMGEKVGRLTGRLEAVEGRLDRHESYVGQQISAMNTKLDKLCETVAMSAGRFSMATLLWTTGGAGLGGFVLMKVLNLH